MGWQITDVVWKQIKLFLQPERYLFSVDWKYDDALREQTREYFFGLEKLEIHEAFDLSVLNILCEFLIIAIPAGEIVHGQQLQVDALNFVKNILVVVLFNAG